MAFVASNYLAVQCCNGSATIIITIFLKCPIAKKSHRCPGQTRKLVELFKKSCLAVYLNIIMKAVYVIYMI